MTAPIIGITTFRHLNSYGHPLISINEAYVKAVARSGAIPLLIPLGLPESSLDQLLDRLDGIIFTGGGDIHPENYGSQLHPKVDEVDPDRDRVEISPGETGLRHRECRSWESAAVCRSSISLWVALCTRISPIRGRNLREHQYYPDWPRDYLAHSVSIVPGSRLR